MGSVPPQALAQSCSTARLPEPSGPPLCHPPPKFPLPPYPRRRSGSVTHSVGGGGTKSEFLETIKWPMWCQGRMCSHGWPQGQGLGQKWVWDWLCTRVSG